MNLSVLDYLENTASRFPGKTAFRDGEESFTFELLLKNAQKIATHISALTEPKKPVAVYMKKHAYNIQAFLGAVYAGCFYVPVDSGMPHERIRSISGCLEPGVVLCDDDTMENASEYFGHAPAVNYKDALQCEISSAQLAGIREQMCTTDLLYVLFTSGSTGIPKGVTVSHAAVIDFTDWICSRYAMDENTSLCSQAPFYFDASVPDIYIPLKTGAALYIPPEGYYTFPKKALQYVKEHHVNTLVWVPSALCSVVNCRAFDVCVPESVRLVIFCGEAMPCRHLNVWKKYLPNARYVSMYGPTECTYACMYYEIDREFGDDGLLPLGKACENSTVLLLNEKNEPAGEGETGEICVSGQCLSSGYYNAGEKTDEVFVQNPLNRCWNETIYRTGDLAVRKADGQIVFAGRKDFQIKKLGYRIELGEIEHALLSVQGVESACCLFDERNSSITAVYAGSTEASSMHSVVKEKLPSYMLPDRYCRIESMPLNINGKTDRARLKKEYAGG